MLSSEQFGTELGACKALLPGIRCILALHGTNHEIGLVWGVVACSPWSHGSPAK